MAKITRDTHVDSSNRKKVVIQLGTPVLDNELNEMQDIIMTEATEGIAAIFSSLRPTTPGQLNPVIARGTDFEPYLDGSFNVFIRAGTMYVQGYRLVLSSDLSLAGLVAGNASYVDHVYGLIYCDVTLTEVNATVDPTIAVPLLGETSVRRVLTMTWHDARSYASYEDAFSTIPALPTVAGGQSVWGGNTARVFVARYIIDPSAGNISPGSLIDIRQGIPGEQNVQKFLKTVRYSNDVSEGDNGTHDGMVSWDLSHSQLIIGVHNTASPTDRGGLVVRQAGSPAHYMARTTGVAPARYGSGDANGPSVIPDWTKGWTLNPGDALGYSGSSASHQFIAKTGATPYLNDVSPSELTVVPVVYQQTLLVASLDSFNSYPGSFVICYRRGNDLIWYDGHITRGVPLRPVLDTPGEAPSPYNAIVCADGNQTSRGANHASGPDALDRVLQFMLEDAPTHVLGVQNLRVFARGGTYWMPRGIKRYGISTESYYNSITIEGETGFPTTIQATNPISYLRTVGVDLAVLNFVGGTITFRNINFQQDADVDHPCGYVLNIEADTVILEGCTFGSGVRIKADNIIVTNSSFSISRSANGGFVGVTSAMLEAQYLFLTPRTSNNVNWRVYGNRLYPYRNLNNTDAFMGHAGIIIDALNDGIIRVEDNIFDGKTGQQDAPSIHINGDSGFITIRKNRFVGAYGRSKPGNKNTQGLPGFGNSYDGTPLQTTGAGTKDLATVACGYISCTKTRKRSSKIEVKDNFFDFSYCGFLTSRYTMWGAFMWVFNSVTAGSAATNVFSNVEISDNRCRMSTDDTAGWNGTYSAGAAGQPALWGFYIACTQQDGSAYNYVVENVSISDNYFDIGGDAPGGYSKIWRSIVGRDPTNYETYLAWPTDGLGYMTDTSYLIGIVLRGTASGSGITVEKNKIMQRLVAGGQAPYQPGIDTSLAVDVSTAYPAWWFYPIWVEIQGASGDDDAAVGSRLVRTAANMFGVSISENIVLGTVYVPAGTGGVRNLSGISCFNAYAGRVSDNTIHLTPNSGTVGIDTVAYASAITRHNRVFMTGNTVSGYIGIHCNGDDGAVANHLFNCVTAISPYLSASTVTALTNVNLLT